MPRFLLRNTVFRAFLIANASERLAASAMTVLLGFQIYELTHNTLDLAWLGLLEAIPGISLVLYGGHIADRHSRRRIVLIATALLAALAGGVAFVSGQAGQYTYRSLLLLAFLAAVVRAFEDPAASGLEAHVLPIQGLLPGIALLATAGRLSDVLGPVAGGLAWATLGPAWAYCAIAALFAISCITMLLGVPEQVARKPRRTQRPLHGITEGVRYVVRDQVLLGSMLLDLFAVFFGGATALLPVFATTILHIGPLGFGLLRSAGAVGSLTAAFMASRLLPQRKAGHVLLTVIAGFGVSIVVFGLSRSLPLSLAALFLAGLCDGTSVVIRRTILRLASPDDMRGRIAAVKSVFVGSSNELGAFESGLAATLLGASAAVWSGGLITLGIVAVTAWWAPRLRELDLETFARADTAPSLERT